jgi:hypothetical protein
MIPSLTPSEVPTGSQMPSESPTGMPVLYAINLTKADTLNSTNLLLVEESTFSDAPCSRGLFGSENVKVTKLENQTVYFTLRQPFLMDRFTIWMNNPEPKESQHYCWYSNDFTNGSQHIFSAWCDLNGMARFSVVGGFSSDTSFSQIGIEQNISSPHCQPTFDVSLLPDFNPTKECYWELSVSCEAPSNRRVTRVLENDNEAISIKDKRKSKFVESISSSKYPKSKSDKGSVETNKHRLSFFDLLLQDFKMERDFSGERLSVRKPSDMTKVENSNFLRRRNKDQ